MRWMLLLAALNMISLQAAIADDPARRWEPAIQKFEAQDRKSPPPKAGVLFVGSSSIRMWDLDESFPKKNYINRGFGGSQIADSIAYLDRLVLKHKPRVVILYAGDNDIAAGKSPKTVARDFQTFQEQVHAALPNTRILYIAIKPSLKRWKLYPKMKAANQKIAEICRQEKRLTFLDIATPMLGDHGKPQPSLFADDGLHLNAAGYALWTEIVTPHLKSVE